MIEIAAPAGGRRSLVAASALVRRFAREARTPSFVLFITGYVALVAWFKWAELHPDTGALGVVHHVLRAIFAVYLFAIVYGVGAPVLRLVAARTHEGVNLPDHLALSFFAGTGLWQMAMLVLGALHLDTVPVVLALTLPPLAIAHPMLAAALGRARPAAPLLGGGAAGRHSQAAFVVLAVLVLAGGIVLLGRTVTSNEVWRELADLKGAGVFRFAARVGDPFAPQLVLASFMATSAVALFQFVRRFMAETLWLWVAVILFLVVTIYAPGPVLWRQLVTGVDDALRMFSAALVAGTLCLTAGAIERRSRLSLAWTFTVASLVIAAAIVDPWVAAYLGAVFALLALWYLARRDHKPAITCLALCGVTAVVLAAGVAMGQGLRFEAVADAAGETTFVPFDALLLLLRSLRIDLLYPLVGGGVVVALAAVALRVIVRVVRRQHRSGIPAPYHAAVLWVSLLILVAIGLFAGRALPPLADRYASVGVPSMIAAGIWLWAAPYEPSFPWLRDLARWWPVPVLVLAACLAAAAAA